MDVLNPPCAQFRGPTLAVCCFQKSIRHAQVSCLERERERKESRMKVRVGCKKGENGGKGVRWEICRGVKRRGAEGKNALKDAKRKKKSQKEQRRRNEKRKVGEKAKNEEDRKERQKKFR